MSFSPLFLTTSLDWTVCLWSSREHKPLHIFDDYCEYVYDARWSPVHPAVFAAVDGAGHVDIWNINQDVEVSVVSGFFIWSRSKNEFWMLDVCLL